MSFASVPTLTLRSFLSTSLILPLLLPACPLLSQDCPALNKPKPHNDPPLLVISLAKPEVGPKQEQQITVTASLPIEHDGDYLLIWVLCNSEDKVFFRGTAQILARRSVRRWMVQATLPGFTGKGGTCETRADLDPKDLNKLGGYRAAKTRADEKYFRLLHGMDVGKRPPRVMSRSEMRAVKFGDVESELWEDQEPTLDLRAASELNQTAERMKKVVHQLHRTICNNTASELELWKAQQDALTVIRSAREYLLKLPAARMPIQARRIDEFTHDLEERLIELRITGPNLGPAQEHLIAFNPLPTSDLAETTRTTARALLHELETIWDALTDVENTKLLYLSLSITSCPTHSRVEYNAKGYSPDSTHTDTILQLTKARIHFKLSDPTTSRTIEFERDFFAQPERRVAVWCKDDPTADVWYLE